jgi:hypothetical protein
MSEPKSKLYPEIVRTELVTETELNAMIAKKVNNQNLEMIKTKYRELSLKLTHYDKVRRRYAKLSSAVRVAGIVIATGFGAASIVTGSLLLPPVIPIVLGSASLLQGVISEVHYVRPLNTENTTLQRNVTPSGSTITASSCLKRKQTRTKWLPEARSNNSGT